MVNGLTTVWMDTIKESDMLASAYLFRFISQLDMILMRKEAKKPPS